MRVIQINSVCGRGSTGKICVAISQLLFEQNIDNKIFYFYGKSNYEYSEKIVNSFYLRIQSFFSHLFGNYGFNSIFSTYKTIRKIKEYQPDVVHIHNIHGHELNLKILLSFIRKNKIKVIYTMHDCWPITGYCVHFLLLNCEKWKTKCCKCPARNEYSFFFDRSSSNYKKKQNSFDCIDMTIVTPSNWLSNVVKESFLKQFPIKVIHNGIDLSIFKTRISSFLRDYHLIDNYVILGVAEYWGEKKGLDVFIKLSKMLPNKYRIVLVGTDDKIDKQLPSNIVSIHKTRNQIELAKIYSSADLFVNPSREENFPTVNIEALACGTPVLTFNVGGSAEIIDKQCGSYVERDDIESMAREITRICETKPFTSQSCLKRALSFDFSKNLNRYISLYKEVLKFN